jgi:ATP-dependent protease ClpP protease subunit
LSAATELRDRLAASRRTAATTPPRLRPATSPAPQAAPLAAAAPPLPASAIPATPPAAGGGHGRTAPGLRRGLRAVRWLAPVALLALLAAFGALAFRGGDDPGRTRIGFTLGGLTVQGPLEPTAVWRFAGYLTLTILLDADGETKIQLDSPGGNLDAALAIARALDLAGGLTRVTTAISPGGTCQSACIAIFAAGAERRAAADALLMIHAPRFAGLRHDPGASGRVEEAAERRYLNRIDAADPALVSTLRRAGAFDRAEPTWLRAGELVAGGYLLVTALDPPRAE